MNTKTLEFYNLDKNIKHSISNLSNFLLSDIDKLRTINSLRESILETIDEFIMNKRFDIIGLNWLNEIYCMIQTYKQLVGRDMVDDFQYFENYVFHGLYLNESVYSHLKHKIQENPEVLNCSRYETLKLLHYCITTGDDSKLTIDEVNKLRSTSVKMSYLLLLFDFHPNLKPDPEFLSPHRELENDEFVYVVDRDDFKTGIVRHSNLRFDDNIAPSIKYKFKEHKQINPKIISDVELQHCVDYNNFHLSFWFKILSLNHKFMKHKIADDKKIISDYKIKRLGLLGGLIGSIVIILGGVIINKV